MEDHTEVKVVMIDEIDLPNVGTLYHLDFEIEFIWVDKGWGAYEFWGSTGVHHDYVPEIIEAVYLGEEHVKEVEEWMNTDEFFNMIVDVL